MIRDDVAGARKPEGGELVEHPAFVGNARAQHVIERRNAIGGDQDQRVAGRVDIAHFAATDQ